MFMSGGIVNPLPGVTLSYTHSPTASSRLRISTDGWVRHATTTGPTQKHQWHTGGGDTSLFVRFTLISGATPNIGTLNTWQQLNADRDIGYSASSTGIASGVIKVEIATDSGGTNIISTSSPNYTVEAEVP
jgi:hypothetical protein